jgi:hypothetical protein
MTQQIAALGILKIERFKRERNFNKKERREMI